MASKFDSEDREPPLIDVHFKVIFNNIDNSNPFSKESKDMIREVGNIELCELLDVEPKAQCKYVCRTGTSASSYCTCGHFCEMERKRIRNSFNTQWISFRFPITTSRKGDHTATATGRKKGITSTSSRIRSRRNARREISWVFTTLLQKKLVCTATISVYCNNWWIRSNFVGSDTMHVRHRADFKEAMSTLRRLKNQEDQACYQNWWQSSSSSWWNWQDSWWHPSSEYHHDDGPSTDRSGKPDKG